MSRSMVRLLLTIFCTVLMLMGCPQPAPKPTPLLQPPPPMEPPPPSVPPFSMQPYGDNDRLLAYYGFISSLTSDQLTLEYNRTLGFYRQQYSDFTFMQLVMLRVLPSAPFRDSAQAREMLSSFLKEPRAQSSELWPLAVLLHTMLIERQQKDTEVQAQAQKLKEETRRYEEVKQKLDALMDAERKMLDRNKPVGKP
jgi:hypothetical protein